MFYIIFWQENSNKNLCGLVKDPLSQNTAVWSDKKTAEHNADRLAKNPTNTHLTLTVLEVSSSC